jgi:AcrR family transcriptional regulator
MPSQTLKVKVSPRTSLDTGRVNQKARTRDALVAVAAEMIAEGHDFTVGEVAERARVGKTTAYRYFPTQDILAAYAAVWKTAHLEHLEFDRVLDNKSSVADKLDALVAHSDKSTRDHEKEYRTMLRASLEAAPPAQELPRRSAFRHEIVSKAMSGLEKTLGKERFERVVSALCLFVGIEALVVTRDICRLPPERAKDVKRWAAQALLQMALNESDAVPRKGRTKTKPSGARLK